MLFVIFTLEKISCDTEMLRYWFERGGSLVCLPGLRLDSDGLDVLIVSAPALCLR